MDYNIIKNATYFSIGGIGYANNIPKEIIAYYKISNSKNAKDIFIKLFHESTIEGKLYALTGLYYFDYENYDKYLTILEKNKNSKVDMFIECLKYQQELGFLIENTDKNHNKDFKNGGIPKIIMKYIKSHDIVLFK